MCDNIKLSREALRAIILYHFKSNTNAAQAQKLICAAFGENAVNRATCFNWYKRFASGDYGLEDQPRAGRPEEIDDDTLLTMIEENPTLTTRELAQKFVSMEPSNVICTSWEKSTRLANGCRMI